MTYIHNPYGQLRGGTWVKGNLHAHSTRSDGSRTQQNVLDVYADLGYDFLSLSDHDLLTVAEDYESLRSHGLILIPGNEISANGPHLLHVGARSLVAPSPDRQTVLNDIDRSGGFAVVNHPNWHADYNHCSYGKLVQWTGYVGIEIYNGVINRLEGSPYATDKWDRILSTGRRIWGFANDDSHAANGDDALGWNVAYVTERTPEAVLDALHDGRFYASTGVVIDNIQVDGDRIRVSTRNAGRLSAFMRNGVRLKYADASDLEVLVPPQAGYIRFECWGAGETSAWTQPFFVLP